MDIQDRILNVLNENGLDQKDLAHGIGVASSTLNGWLKKKRSIPAEYIIPICEFLGVPVGYVLTGIETSFPVSGDPSSGWVKNGLEGYERPLLILTEEGEEVIMPEENRNVEGIAKLRTDRALTARIVEVARAVYMQEENEKTFDSRIDSSSIQK